MKKLTALISILLVIALFAGCNGETVDPNARGNTPGNLVNEGIAAISGDWI